MFDRNVGRLNAGELDIFVGPDFLVTIPNQPLQPVAYLFERCRSKEELREQLFGKGSGFLLYKIIDDSFDYCFPMLRKIGNKLDALEEEIFSGRSEEVVRDIFNVKQEIINFRKIVRPQRPVLRDLERTKQRFLAAREGEDLEIYFDDIVDAHERIWDMLENDKEVVEGLEETNESVISHRVNDILRVLTVISVILLPLTLLASIMGMNVRVPRQGTIGERTGQLDALPPVAGLAIRRSQQRRRGHPTSRPARRRTPRTRRRTGRCPPRSAGPTASTAPRRRAS